MKKSFFVFSILFINNTIFGAITSSWTVDGGGNWSIVGNWDNGVPNGVDDTAIFPSINTINRTITVNIPVTLGTLQLTPLILPAPKDWILSSASNSITMQGTDPTISLTQGTSTINVEVIINSALKIIPATGSILTVTKPIIGTGDLNIGTLTSGGGTLILDRANTYVGQTNIVQANVSATIDNAIPSNSAITISSISSLDTSSFSQNVGSIAGSGSLVMAGALSDFFQTGNDNTDTNFSGTISGANTSLIKVGSGIFTLSGSNTYTGATTVNGGTLSITTDSNLGSGTSALTLSASTTLQANGASSLSSHTITLGGAATVDTNGSSFNIASVISGSGPLTKINAGTLTLSGNNSYASGTTVNNGTLAITTDSNLGSGTSALTLSAGTTLQANGASSLSSHTITLGGAAIIDTNGNSFAIASTISGSGPLTKNNAGTLTLTGMNTYGGGTVVDGGTLAITVDSNLGGGISTLTLNTGSTLQANGISSISGHPIILGGSATIDTNGNPFTISSVISGSGPLTKINAGSLTLTGSNTYLGATNINNGTLAISTNANLGAGASLLTLAAGTTLQASGSGTVSSHPIDLLGNATFDTNGNSFAISSIISGSGPLTKINAGTLTLAGNNTYSGGTNINNGTLAISTDSNLGIGASLLTLAAGTTLQASGSGTVSSHPIDLLGAATFDTNGNAFAISSVISGIGPLTKINAGMLTLAGANTYSADTIVSGGTLAITTDTNLGSGTSALTLNAGTTLQANGASSLSSHTITLGGAATIDTNGSSFDIASVISGSGPLTKINAGILTLSGNNTYTLGTTVNGGTLAITTDSNLGIGTSALTLNADTTLQANGASSLLSHTITLGGSATIDTNGNTFNITSTINGSGPLIKNSAGTLTLTGINIYSEGTIVNDGTLSINMDSNLGGGVSTLTLNTGSTLQANGISSISGHPIILGGSTTIDTNGNPFTISSVISGSGPLTKINAGTLTLTGNNTYTAGTNINDGTLAISTNANLGTNSSLLTLAAGTTLQASGSGTVSSHPIDLLGATTFDTNGNSFDISSVISGSGPLTKINAGTLTLTGNNTYTAGTNINNGTLAISTNANLGANTSLLTLAAGTTLQASGSGTVSSHPIDLLGDATFDTNGNSFDISSVISGVGPLTKINSGTLTLSGTNTYSDDTIVNNGTLAVANDSNLGADSSLLILNSGTTLQANGNSSILLHPVSLDGTVNIDSNGNTFDIGSAIVGSGSLTKINSGTLVLEGTNVYAGSTTVTGGQLYVNGSIGGTLVTILLGGTLGGTGTINTSVTNNGIVKPGLSIGTLTINGNYVQSPTGTLEIELDPEGNCDLLAINGSASLDGTLALLPDPGTYLPGTTYDVLVASAGVTGTFVNIPRGGLQVQVNYLPNLVQLQIIQRVLGDMSFSGNPGIIQHYLESLVMPAGSDIFNVFNLLDDLPSQELYKALDQLHPALFGAIDWASVTEMTKMSKQFVNHAKSICYCKSSCCASANELWFDGVGNWTHQSHMEGLRGFNLHDMGIMGGADHNFDKHSICGIAVGYNSTDLDWHQDAGDSSIWSLPLGIYAAYCHHSYSIDAALLTRYENYHSKRHIHFPGLNRHARSHNHGTSIDGHIGVEGNFEIKRFHSIELQPFVNIDYFYLHQSPFKEKGASSLNLNVEKHDAKFLRSELGLGIAKDFYFCDWVFMPKVKGSWVCFAPLAGKHFHANFVEFTDTFTVFTTDEVVNAFAPEIDLTFLFKEKISISASYSGEFSSKRQAQNAILNISWHF